VKKKYNKTKDDGTPNSKKLLQRYEKLKSLTPTEFTQLFESHLLLDKEFDELLDNFIPYTPALNKSISSKKDRISKDLHKNPPSLEDSLDHELYPTRKALEYILNYEDSIKAPYKLLDYIQSLWMFNDWGWKEQETLDMVGSPKTRIFLSTGGWSGNESIIEALKKNRRHFWQIFWEESRRGGHYKLLISPRSHYELKDK